MASSKRYTVRDWRGDAHTNYRKLHRAMWWAEAISGSVVDNETGETIADFTT